MLNVQALNRPFLLAALLVAALGCNERQTEPDYDALIEDTCRSTCPITTECNPDPFYDTTEECIEMCIAAERWDDLNQCDSRTIEHSSCVATLTCEQYGAYLDSLEMDGPDESYPCLDQLNALYACDPEQPFEEPE